jgi:hypothetical protein
MAILTNPAPLVASDKSKRLRCVQNKLGYFLFLYVQRMLKSLPPFKCADFVKCVRSVNDVHMDIINPLNAELIPICYLLALLAYHFLHVSRIRVKSLTLRHVKSYIFGAPILDVSRSHTTTHHSR